MCAFFLQAHSPQKILDFEIMLFRLQFAQAKASLDLVRAKVEQGT
jgi:hypothetical protein